MNIKKIIFSAGCIFAVAFGAVIFSQTMKSGKVVFKGGFQNDTGETLVLGVDSNTCFERAANVVPKRLPMGRVNLADLTAKEGCQNPEIHLVLYSQQGDAQIPVGQIFYDASGGAPFSVYQVNNPDYEISAVSEAGRFVIKINRKVKY